MRNEIRAEVANIDPLDEIEREHIAEVLKWIDSGAELCRVEKPATPPKHLVSYFMVVDGENLLLVDHKNLDCGYPVAGTSNRASIREPRWHANFERNSESNLSKKSGHRLWLLARLRLA